MIGFEDPLGEEEIIYCENSKTKQQWKENSSFNGNNLIGERKNPPSAVHKILRTPKPPVHFRNSLIAGSAGRNDENMKNPDGFRMSRPFVPVTPSVLRTPFIGNVHRENSGFAVPETPSFVNALRVTTVKETPLIG